MNAAGPERRRNRWSAAWLDALAFLLGLGLAWYFQWQTADLVWSLWLSSLVIGYATLLWTITLPLREVLRGVAGTGVPSGLSAGSVAGGMTALGCGTAFFLVFFTIHFGGFHLGHSIFLNLFFPVLERTGGGFPGWETYVEVLRRYWWFLPAAALAEREAFRPRRLPEGLSAPEALKARFGNGDAMMAPYRNVIRMHLLIFFFAFAYFMHLSNFLVYAVAYAAYFFPWRLLRRRVDE